MDLPLGLLALMNDRFAFFEIKGDVIVKGVKIEKIFFDFFCFVSKCDHKFGNSVMGISFHNMPKNGLSPDLEHWFGSAICHLRKARSKSARKNDRFHCRDVL